MSDFTILEVKAEMRDLESILLGAIVKFESLTGMEIDTIDWVRDNAMSMSTLKSVSVEAVIK